MKFLIGCIWLAAAVSYAAAQSGVPRTADGKPDLQGIWQVLNTASYDIRPHSPALGIPGGWGVIDGDDLPYKPEAAAQQKDNFEHRATEDPLNRCFLPGIPRMIYLPFPFQIFQTPEYVIMTSSFVHADRIITLTGKPHLEGIDFWMGDSRGHWEGDTLVVDVKDFNDQTWLDASGNFHSDVLHVIERFTRTDRDTIQYEATIDDPKVFTRTWKMSMPLHRVTDKGAQIVEYDCYAYQEAESEHKK